MAIQSDTGLLCFQVLFLSSTGIYIGWRCPEFKHDCQRVGDSGKCFCGHLLTEHASYTGELLNVT